MTSHIYIYINIYIYIYIYIYVYIYIYIEGSVTDGNVTEKLSGTNLLLIFRLKQTLAKLCLQLLDRNFPPQHRLHRIINRNTMKISYLCMPDMASHIYSHNKSIIQESKK